MGGVRWEERDGKSEMGGVRWEERDGRSEQIFCLFYSFIIILMAECCNCRHEQSLPRLYCCLLNSGSLSMGESCADTSTSLELL